MVVLHKLPKFEALETWFRAVSMQIDTQTLVAILLPRNEAFIAHAHNLVQFAVTLLPNHLFRLVLCELPVYYP